MRVWYCVAIDTAFAWSPGWGVPTRIEEGVGVKIALGLGAGEIDSDGSTLAEGETDSEGPAVAEGEGLCAAISVGADWLWLGAPATPPV
jgi:hypothetical protein